MLNISHSAAVSPFLMTHQGHCIPWWGVERVNRNLLPRSFPPQSPPLIKHTLILRGCSILCSVLQPLHSTTHDVLLSLYQVSVCAGRLLRRSRLLHLLRHNSLFIADDSAEHQVHALLWHSKQFLKLHFVLFLAVEEAGTEGIYPFFMWYRWTCQNCEIVNYATIITKYFIVRHLIRHILGVVMFMMSPQASRNT